MNKRGVHTSKETSSQRNNKRVIKENRTVGGSEKDGTAK